MDVKNNLNTVYRMSEDIAAREVQEELIIVPLVPGIGDMDDELFVLNDAGMAIWDRLDGKRTLKEIVEELSAEFVAPRGEIEEHVTLFVKELLMRRLIIEVSIV
jgi:hypothetical protein